MTALLLVVFPTFAQAGIVDFAQNYTEGDLVITGCTNDAEVSTSAQIWGVAGICGMQPDRHADHY